MNRAAPYQLKAFSNEVKVVLGSFETQSDGTISGTGNISGNGLLSVEKSAEGRYKVHLKDTWYALAGAPVISFLAAVQDSSPYVAAEDVDSATDPYITIGFHAAGSDADINSAKVLMTLFLKNSAY